MQARRPIMSAFPGGAAAAALLLACVWAPYAAASKIGTDCPDQRTDPPAAFDVAAEELESRLTETAPVHGAGKAAADRRTEVADRVPSSPEFDAVMTRILEASMPTDTADEADAAPVAEADVDAEAAENPPTASSDWASDSARLPGLSEAAAERYRRQMFRTDI